MTTHNTPAPDTPAPKTRKPVEGVLTLVGIGVGLVGALADWRWLVYTALLILLGDMAAIAVSRWRRGDRRTGAVAAVLATAGLVTTLWLASFPPALVRWTLTLAGVAAIAAIGISVNRRTRGCFPAVVGGPSAAGARALLDHTDRPDIDRPGTDGGERR